MTQVKIILAFFCLGAIIGGQHQFDAMANEEVSVAVHMEAPAPKVMRGEDDWNLLFARTKQEAQYEAEAEKVTTEIRRNEHRAKHAAHKSHAKANDVFAKAGF